MKSISRFALYALALLSVILTVGYTVSFYEPSILLWVPIFLPLVTLYAIRSENSRLAEVAFLLAVYTTAFWFVDSVFYFLGGSNFGRVEMLSESLPEWLFLILLIHILLLIPVCSAQLTGKTFPKETFLNAAFLYVIVILPLSYVFASVDNNINCVLYPCDWDSEDRLLSINTGYFFPVKSSLFRYSGICYLIKEMVAFLVYLAAAWAVNELIPIMSSKEPKPVKS